MRSAALVLGVLGVLVLLGGRAGAEPDVAGTWGVSADETTPITVTARFYIAGEGVFGNDVLAGYDAEKPPIVNGADLGAETELALVIAFEPGLGERRVTVTVKNGGHTTRRRWKVRPYVFELVVAHVETCEPIQIAIKVGRTRVARTIDSGCFE